MYSLKYVFKVKINLNDCYWFIYLGFIVLFRFVKDLGIGGENFDLFIVYGFFLVFRYYYVF